jgi:hypothetical protein
MPETSEAAEQLTRVVKFREELFKEGLARDYGEHAEFADNVRRDLVLVLGQMLHARTSPADIAAQAARLTTKDDREATLEAIQAFAHEYDALRAPITGMRAGPDRTRLMEVVASKMRAMAVSTYPFLSDLMTSGSAGSRLAAVLTLEAVPDPRHLEWLAQRVALEKPFVGYHAALALLSAARSLTVDQLPEVRAAVALAREGTRHLRPDTDRETMLRHADAELDRRMTRVSRSPAGR